ncbi:MAG: hypothetical protein ABI540_09425 [Spartobacteria bacterium]
MLPPYNPNPPVATGFTPPDWVLVTRSGPAVKTAIGAGATALNNSNPANSDFVIGRYAYAIYDEGGLIDANVAGYPTGTTAGQAGRKGYISFADLTLISTLTQPQIDRIVGWRNSASAQVTPSPQPNAFPVWTFDTFSATRYFTSVLSNANGFLTVSNAIWPIIPNPRTDQAFVTRQQLLKFRTDTSFTQNSLQYLGTFSRELNRPSWKPSVVSTINPELNTVQVTGSFLRADGTTALVGEPLFKNRFPLTRINELANTANIFIQRDFGLLWDAANNRWKYVGGTGSTIQSTIETLYQVASENREPNFFEILKATILNGSVGLGSGPGDTFVAAETKYYITGTTPSNLLSADTQIMQIGANIIDAWDSLNIPTFIYFANDELAGVENLPYLNKLVFTPFFPTPNGGGYFDAWLIPSLWNPNQNAASATGTVRIALTGAANWKATGRANSDTTVATCNSISPLPATMDVSVGNFSLPTPQTSTPTAYTVATVSTVGNPEKFWGFHYPFSASTTNATLIDQKNGSSANPDFGSGGTNVELQLQVGTPPVWKSYQTWKIAAGIGTSVQLKGVKQNIFNSNKLQDPEFVALDPRTVRFGIWSSNANDTGKNKKDYTDGADDSMDQSKAALEAVSQLPPQGANFVTTDGKATAYLYSVNSSTSANYYKDIDLITRQADWTTGNGAVHTSTIMYGSNSADRPQLPSAAFQSVAEVGQVFRDQPWKTLAFTIANSGDAGLLDVFTLQDVPMTAGRASLNTRQSAVLKAILSQAAKNLTGTSIITPAERDNVITALTALTAASPMISKGELVTRLAGDASVTALKSKEARECVVRAFSDACQTRTWNLMIDVIAQSGRYPPTAIGLANFLVEGERRYWLHVAIDRFTGEVIDQQLEAVYE